MKIRLVYQDGRTVLADPTVRRCADYTAVSFSKELVEAGCSHIDFLFDYFTAEAGDDGYFVLPMEATQGTWLTRFVPREDTERAAVFSHMACYGINRGKSGTLGIVTGMMYDMTLVAGVKAGHYYAYPRFLMDGDLPYEDFEVRYYELEDGDYSAMARVYRQYQMTERGCVPLKERVEADPRLKKSASGLNVRIRMGWKPAPSPIEYQTPENEPPMHVACTFDRAAELTDEFRRQGIEDAEFCLVGWNYGGHDGRFPQIFPPDPRLGGEDGLKALIKRAQANGYSIVCHDDATAAYFIADCWDEEYLLKKKDGSLYLRPVCWSGGRPHKVCPQRQYERFEVSNMKALSELGFEGIHYIDVITILELLKCYDPAHLLTRKDSAAWYRKIMKLARKTFGGFSSEAGYDFAASDMDFAMYTSFLLLKDELPALCDEPIPFWQLVYHGIILYNPGTATLNYPAKGTANRLKYFEYGGRPLVVYYANFKGDDHWMGLEDFHCGTDEEMTDSVSKIRQMAEDYKTLECVRYAFMDRHEKLADGRCKTTYSNGITITVDYNTGDIEIVKP